MKPHHVIAILLAVAVLLMNAAMASIDTITTDFNAITAFVFGTYFGQVAMVAGLLVMTDMPTWLRLGVACSAVTGNAFCIFVLNRHQSFPSWIGFLAIYVGLLCALLAPFRIWGWRIRPLAEASVADAVAVVRRGQFSIGSIFVLMLVVALISAAVKFIPLHELLVVSLYCLAFMGNAWVTLWAAWSNRFWLVRIVVAVSAIFVSGFLCRFIEPIGGDKELLFVLTTAQALFVFVATLILRCSGLRLMRLGENTPAVDQVAPSPESTASTE